MTSGIGSATVASTYANNMTKNVSNAKEEPKTASSKEETAKTKVEAIKEKIASGEYKIDIDSLAKKMAEELLS